jgi:hypothetical protein
VIPVVKKSQMPGVRCPMWSRFVQTKSFSFSPCP